MRSSALFILLSIAANAQPVLTHTDVFRAGIGGYNAYRIPAIVTAADGTLVAFAEARRDNRGDPGNGDIDIVSSRSRDSGATWSPMKVIDDPGEKWSASNPTPVLDKSNGRLWLFCNRWEPGFGTEAARPGTSNNQTWARSSDDNGQTWSAPRDLTRATRDYDHWGAIFLGPGGAIQTKNGRLIIPAAMKYDAFRLYGPNGPTVVMRAYTIFSDDHGQSWRRNTLTDALADENQLVELLNGSILMDARQNSGDRRWNIRSTDGGVTWLPPLPGQAVTPVATSIERFDAKRLIWTGPIGPGRKSLVVRVSYDEGQTWINERTIYGGLASYSDATILNDGTAGILWERGETAPVQFITFTRFNLEFLEPPGALIPRIR